MASLGTALTPWQVGQAMRFASRLVVNYDGDSAGRTAAARAVPLGLEKGLNIDVLVLPDDLDPDAYLRKHGRDKYLALMKKTVPGLDFLIDSLAAGARMAIPEEKGKVARAVVREIEKVPDPVARSEYLRRASAKLGVGEELLRDIVENKAPDKGPEEPGLFCPAEKRLFQILMGDPLPRALRLRRVRRGDLPGTAERARLPVHPGVFQERRGAGASPGSRARSPRPCCRSWPGRCSRSRRGARSKKPRSA